MEAIFLPAHPIASPAMTMARPPASWAARVAGPSRSWRSWASELRHIYIIIDYYVNKNSIYIYISVYKLMCICAWYMCIYICIYIYVYIYIYICIYIYTVYVYVCHICHYMSISSELERCTRLMLKSLAFCFVFFSKQRINTAGFVSLKLWTFSICKPLLRCSKSHTSSWNAPVYTLRIQNKLWLTWRWDSINPPNIKHSQETMVFHRVSLVSWGCKKYERFFFDYEKVNPLKMPSPWTPYHVGVKLESFEVCLVARCWEYHMIQHNIYIYTYFRLLLH